ncbi:MULTISPECIES: aspartyl protease family protein [Spirosoma]|uniref:Aspartyl protease family protein n=1 Tax=Spirosoma liriopis TaxID=2937440 RepID=A0ABT0HJ73_9BACT|nr:MULTISPECIES: aspartyl protease family protein [Spirosoma]MCK8492214.1 aspartyl protease family protein [Spirosoma liriopis]UHG91631.1 aspartyl protease family protein [Spirosoma oryzicola]
MKAVLLAIGMLCICLDAWAKDGNKGTPDRDRYGFYIAGNRSWTRIPFQLHSNLIIVPVRINDSDTLHFILDTGVSNTIITDPSIFKKQPLTLARKMKIAGAGEGANLTASIAINNNLRMGDLRASHHNIVLLDEDILKLSEFVGTPVHGIFGYELFANFVVNVDFTRRELVIMQPKKYRYRKRKGDRYPITIQDTKAYTDALSVYDGEKSMPLRVVLDTGAGHALLLDPSRSTNAMPLPAKVVRAQLGRGLNGVINGSMGRIQKIKFGRYELDNILASFPDSTAFGMKLVDMPERQGNVGCELLRRFNVTFNYPERYVVMKPVKRLMRETFEHDMSGLELRAKGEQLRNYYVGKIIEGSPADLSGLKEGDEVLFVNNYSAKNLTVSDIYKILQKGEGKEVSILVRRNGQMVIAHFALKRFI